MISIFAVWPNDTGEKIYTMLGAAASEGCDGRDAGKARRAQGFTPDIKATAFKSHALVPTLVPRSPQRVVNQAGRRLLPLDGNAQGGDGQFRPHVIAHCPANNFAGEKIEHGGQIEPPSEVGTQVMEAKPNLIGPRGGEVLAGPVGGNRQIAIAVRGADLEPPRRGCPHALAAHEAFDAVTPRRISLAPVSYTHL